MSRGVLYVVWNNVPGGRHDFVLQRSIRSLRRHHPELEHHVAELEGSATLLDKSRMFDLSPFEETLYLDADTIVMGRLDFGFEQAERHHVACAICEAPFACRYRESIRGDVIEYNTGVIFFTRARESRRVFEEWKRLAPLIDSSVIYLNPDGTQGKMPVNDQASFAKAVHDLEFNPRVLPENWNFRPHFMHDFFGPIKIWHAYADPPPGLIEFNDQVAGAPLGVWGFSRIG
ncbi:MAG: hypothetical protein AB7K52_01665 [Phycisphaerales bacterium]